MMFEDWPVPMQNPQQSDQGAYRVTATNNQGTNSKEQHYVVGCVSDSLYK
jgi:hypothetical protein